MKKLIFILLIGLFSCNDNSVTISKQEYYKLKKDTALLHYPKHFKLYDEVLDFNETGIVLASDGHEYLVTHSGTYGQNVEHYIDCEKCKRRDTL